MALEAGYRHIDTAPVYMNEKSIGKVLKEWLDSGRIQREDLFVTTKLPPPGKEKLIKLSFLSFTIKQILKYNPPHYESRCRRLKLFDDNVKYTDSLSCLCRLRRSKKKFFL